MAQSLAYAQDVLPNYGVFDEDRYFQSGQETQVYSRDGIRFGVEICEDLCTPMAHHSSQAIAGGAHLIVDIKLIPVLRRQMEGKGTYAGYAGS